MEFNANPTLVLLFASCIFLLPVISFQTKSILTPSVPCGLRTLQRVIDGKDAPKRWPWQAQILRAPGNSTKFHFSAAGVLIHDQWVLTCTHVIINVRNMSRIRVVLGEHDLSKDEQTEQVYDVIDLRMHFNYSVGPYYVNDIGLIKLDRKVKYTPAVQPICLPKPNVREAPNTKCVLTGWGYSKHANNPFLPNILQEVELPVADFKKCNQTIAVLGPNYYSDNATQFCGGDGGKTNRSACYGDSGGPFSCLENGRYILRGIAAAGQDIYCRTVNNKYTIFDRVSVYIKWIKDQMSTPPPTYAKCVDHHWACSIFAKRNDCNETDGLGYHLRTKYCPIACKNPDC